MDRIKRRKDMVVMSYLFKSSYSWLENELVTNNARDVDFLTPSEVFVVRLTDRAINNMILDVAGDYEQM